MIRYIFLMLFQLSILLGQTTNGMDIFYLIDVSGSYHKEVLKDAVKFSGNLYDELSSIDKPIFPQKHIVDVMDEFGLTSEDCSDLVEQDYSNPFITKSSNTSAPFKDECLSEVLKNSPARNTDLYGSILNAQDYLDYPKKRKALLIFSDFKDNPAAYFEGNINEIDLSGITVILLWSDTEVKAQGAQSRKLANEIRKFLKKKNATNVQLVSLKTLKNDRNALKDFTKNLINISKQ